MILHNVYEYATRKEMNSDLENNEEPNVHAKSCWIIGRCTNITLSRLQYVSKLYLIVRLLHLTLQQWHLVSKAKAVANIRKSVGKKWFVTNFLQKICSQ